MNTAWMVMRLQQTIVHHALFLSAMGLQVHPAGADAAIHAGAALRKEEDKGMMMSVAIGYYGAQNALQGECSGQATACFVAVPTMIQLLALMQSPLKYVVQCIVEG